uniref:Uncharacterized protein n=1 Tax=Arundo donax TaxID=35708 RepID=A0A0A9VFV7_ARUDO
MDILLVCLYQKNNNKLNLHKKTIFFCSQISYRITWLSFQSFAANQHSATI